MKYYIIAILLLFFLLNSNIYIKAININNDEIPKEIKHGFLQNDSWSYGKTYEYYINITDYKLNEENILDLYTLENLTIINLMKVYTLFTNATIEEIMNNKINKSSSQIYYNQSNSSKLDYLTRLIYFFMPYKKTLKDQTYFIIFIEIDKDIIEALNQEIFFSISSRIPTINLKQKENNNKLFSESLKSRKDIYLYYKFEIDKNINLTNNSILFFVNDTSFPIFSTNLSSLETFDNKMFIIQKNKNEASTVYLGLKSLETKNINVTIALHKNDFYLLDGERRINQKLYIEQINCNNQFYIIENYYDLNDVEMQKFLIINKLYGNYSLKYYNSFQNINFEEFNLKENGIEINNKIESIKGKLAIYILNCFTPTAFIFEIFSNDSLASTLQEGEQYKTFLTPSKSGTEMKLSIIDELKKYNFFISLVDKNKDYRNISQKLNCNLRYKDNVNYFTLEKEDINHNEILYFGDFKFPSITFNLNEGAFIYYYLTSNRLFYNIEEGETIVDKRKMQNLALKIKKDLLFDYITFEAESENKEIKANYELKLLNYEFIEKNNRIMAPLPDIIIPESKILQLKFSNPYNKFDFIIKDNNIDYHMYLLISFINFDINSPIYVNVKYIYNKQIVPLKEIKSEIILPDIEYEINGNKNYLNKSLILFNINKCDFSNNYLFIHYYENNQNIINKYKITKKREIIIENNLYFNSKMRIIKEEENNDKNEIIKSFFPADYYYKGNIIFNYFLINEELYNNSKITKDFSIKFKDETKTKITLYWNEYIKIKNKNKNDIHISTNYSFYILPKDSVINSMCQILLIPSNISIINSTKIELKLEKGEYKVAMIASIIDKEFQINNMYDILYLNVSKRLNIELIVSLTLIGIIIALIVLFFLCRKKRIFLCFKRKEKTISTKIEEKKIINNLSNISENDLLSERESTKSKKEEEELIQNLIDIK